jgi:hypothetical protein
VRQALAPEDANRLVHRPDVGRLGDVGLARFGKQIFPALRDAPVDSIRMVVADRLGRDRDAEFFLEVTRDRCRLVVDGKPRHHIGLLFVIEL